jgi:hypothetical protein
VRDALQFRGGSTDEFPPFPCGLGSPRVSPGARQTVAQRRLPLTYDVILGRPGLQEVIPLIVWASGCMTIVLPGHKASIVLQIDMSSGHSAWLHTVTAAPFLQDMYIQVLPVFLALVTTTKPTEPMKLLPQSNPWPVPS